MSGAVPGPCGVHGGWAHDTVPIGEDHGSGGTPAARICLPCGRRRVNRGTASALLVEQIEAMTARAAAAGAAP